MIDKYLLRVDFKVMLNNDLYYIWYKNLINYIIVIQIFSLSLFSNKSVINVLNFINMLY